MGQETPEINGKMKKKAFRKSIVARLEEALADFKNQVTEKKFAGAIKRAGKALSASLMVKKEKKKKKKKEKNNGELKENLAM